MTRALPSLARAPYPCRRRRSAASLALLALLGLLFSGASFAAAQDDDIVKEFKRYFKKYKDTPTRVEAIRALEGVESVEVVDVLLPLMKDKELEVVNAAIAILGGFKSRAPVDAMLYTLEDSKKEEERLGILRAFAVGGYAHDGEAVKECLGDRSWDVRRRAVSALVSTKDLAFVPAILPLCGDSEPAVRCAALDGLAELKAPEGREPAIAAFADDVWQVRASAILLLGIVRHKDSIPHLIERLRVEEGRLREDAAKALENLTGRGFGVRAELWDRFWNSYKDRYEIPTDAELATLREKQAERKAEYQPGEGTTYHGIETPSKSILFVIDVSGSMENEVVERDRFKDGNYPSFSRMDIVKTELQRTIQGLESYVEFNVLAFATEVDPWKKKLVPANVLNKSSADSWVGKLEPIGGSSKQELAEVGLLGAANLGAGKTNTWAAISEALAVNDGKGEDEYEVAVDTIFFLSDGRPTHGRFVNEEEILKQTKEANQLRKIVIHTIAIGEFNKVFMKRLAQENGGVFVDLGR